MAQQIIKRNSWTDQYNPYSTWYALEWHIFCYALQRPKFEVEQVVLWNDSSVLFITLNVNAGGNYVLWVRGGGDYHGEDKQCSALQDLGPLRPLEGVREQWRVSSPTGHLTL